MINISKRLKTIAKIILNGDSKEIIDVGCDHALLDIYLIENNENLRIIASDINELPLENAKKNIEKYSFLNKIEVCLKNGIERLDESIDTIVISGMGYETIKEILYNGKDELKHVDRLILSSNGKYEDLRKEVIKLGYYINYEELVYDANKYYVVIEFLKGHKKYNKKELFFGPTLLKNKNNLFYEYYNKLKDTNESIICKLPSNHNKINKIRKEIELLNEEL